MMKRLLIFMTVAMLLGIAQPTMAQEVQKATISVEQQDISISVNGSTIHVKNAAQMVIEVYNLAGIRVASYKIDSADKTFDFSSFQKGCYILKIGNTVRKVSLK
ncbi:MAG: T9SS type A sorting domain-containing protein [Bacteroidaceae bacterium]|nr:T9SS type A sorting domain-containing protein [Bacteroidaceae bacterium]